MENIGKKTIGCGKNVFELNLPATKERLGVGLLLMAKIEGLVKIFTIRELEDKPRFSKQAGMLSFPIESFNPERDMNEFDTMQRLIDEEIGVPIDQISLMGIIPKIFHPIPGRSDIDIIYGVAGFLGDPDRKFHPIDDDIEFAGWLTPRELLAIPSIRVEVEPIIVDYFTYRHTGTKKLI